uniref:HDC09415 n=1 Tax=Drosophila melanogaster TaxID=7227 RepID=Q6ILH9_DROME|nr:TPA_inf: HDC09415 [Drosophila melanogaster]
MLTLWTALFCCLTDSDFMSRKLCAQSGGQQQLWVVGGMGGWVVLMPHRAK